MNYSRNIRAHALYSGIVGAFLEPNTNNDITNTNNNTDLDETLQRAAEWLIQNNPYLRSYTNTSLLQNQNNPFPRASHINNDINIPPVNSYDLIIPNYNFPDEVHNEDFHYT